MNTELPQDQWESCPPGTIKQLNRSDERQRRRFLQMVGGGAAVLLVGSVTVGYLSGRKQDPLRPQIGPPITPAVIVYNCRETRQLLPKYMRMALTNQELRLIKNHLAICRSCANFYVAKGAKIEERRK